MATVGSLVAKEATKACWPGGEEGEDRTLARSRTAPLCPPAQENAD